MIKKITLLLLGLFVSFIVIQAQTWTQIGVSIEGNSAEDYFCHASLSADGSIVAIGAPGDNNNLGSVSIFQDYFGVWTQIGSTIYGENAGDYSGYSVSLDANGSIVAIGARSNCGGGEYSGHVRVYENIAGNWTQIGEDIDGEEEGDESGFSVSMNSDGSIVAIGAIYNDGNGSLSGHVRIYQNNFGNWIQIGEDINGEAAGDQFGVSIDLNSDGTIVAIGSEKNSAGGSNAGHVRIYQNNSGIWTQIGDDIDGTQSDKLGCSVSLNSDGDIVAIGATGAGGFPSYKGCVKIFQNSEGNWIQLGEDIDGEYNGASFGASISLNSSGSIVAIGAPGNGSNGINSGQVQIYQNNAGIWSQIGESINGEVENDQSGWPVSLNSSGTILAVGAALNDGNGEDAGHVKIYELNTTKINKNKIGKYTVYPNPTNGIINFRFANNNIQNYIISDVTGKLIIEKNNIQLNETVDLSNYTNGIYILRIQTDNEMLTTKIVKE